MIINTTHAPRTQLPRWKVTALAMGSALLLAGCAGNPPSEQLAVTQSAVDNAVSAGGTEFAAVEMKAAQDKLKQAELQLHEENYEEARRLAEQAEWDARLAERKAEATKAEQALHNAQQGIEELREESLRGSQP